MEANRVKVFTILTFGPTRKLRNLTFSQSGTVRIFNRGRIWNCTSFETLTQARSLFYTLGLTSCVRDTEAAVRTLFK